MLKKIFFVGLISLIFSLFLPTTTFARKGRRFKIVTIKAPILYDVHVESNFPNSTVPKAPYAPVGHLNVTQMASRFYLYPDLSKIPPDAKIIKAVLYLDRVSNTWEQDELYRLHPVLEPWREETITWNNQPRFAKRYVLGKRRNYGIFTFNVTRFVRRQIFYKKVFGFVIKKPTEEGDNFGLFATTDYPLEGAETRPYLKITYAIKSKAPR